jgi:hypothetical protein
MAVNEEWPARRLQVYMRDMNGPNHALEFKLDQHGKIIQTDLHSSVIIMTP